eukprot:7728879-Pyramimonas_sp.AAC.1
MEGGPFSICDSRKMWLSLPRRAHSAYMLQEPHEWRAGRFQNVALAIAPREFVLKVRKNITDRGRT